ERGAGCRAEGRSLPTPDSGLSRRRATRPAPSCRAGVICRFRVTSRANWLLAGRGDDRGSTERAARDFARLPSKRSGGSSGQYDAHPACLTPESLETGSVTIDLLVKGGIT